MPIIGLHRFGRRRIASVDREGADRMAVVAGAMLLLLALSLMAVPVLTLL